MGLVFITILYLLFMVHLPLAALTGDACVYLDDQEVDMVGNLGEQAGTIVDACLLNTSLIVAMNLTDQLDFANTLNFTTPDFIDAFDFTQFDSFRANITALVSYCVLIYRLTQFVVAVFLIIDYRYLYIQWYNISTKSRSSIVCFGICLYHHFIFIPIHHVVCYRTLL
jgi:hypothetical protein